MQAEERICYLEMDSPDAIKPWESKSNCNRPRFLVQN